MTSHANRDAPPDEHVQLLIIGFGAAGVAAAITARDAGAPLTRVGTREQREVPGVDAIEVLQPGTSASRLDAKSSAGPRLFASLQESALRYGADVRWGNPAHRLLQASNGAITGAVLESGEVISADSVILSCGCYEFNEPMKQGYLRASKIHFYGNPGNTGPGYVIICRHGNRFVLDTYGDPIDGLYAAGELGQAVGLRYPSDGSNIPEALCFGQIAALSATKK